MNKTRVFLGTALIAGFFGLLTTLHEGEALAYTCNNGICECGSSDINPATGNPVLVSGDWEPDCYELADACARLGGEFTCESGSCLGGTCVYD